MTAAPRPGRESIMQRVAALAAAVLSAAFVLGGCESKPTGPFRQVEGVWHYRDTPIRDVDARTFAPLDDQYAKDAARAYHARGTRDAKEYYLIRRDAVVPLEGADAASFVVLGHGYARDARHAWFDGTRFAVRDAASLRVVDTVYALDRERVYFHQAEIPGSDPASFVRLDDRHCKDAVSVYHGRVEPAPGVPAIRVGAIAGADVSSFAVLEDRYARDAKRAYHDGRPLGSAEGFAVLGFGYAASRTAVFHGGVPVAGADAATFRIRSDAIAEGVDAEDAKARYRSGARVAARP